MERPFRQPRHRRQETRVFLRVLLLCALVVVVVAVTAGIWDLRDHGGKQNPHTVATAPPALPAGKTMTSGPAVFTGDDGTEAAWVVAENQRPGSTAWQITLTPSGTIAGFANVTSARVGDDVSLYVSTDAPSFTVQAYRMGYYGGAGARLVWTSADTPGKLQPSCPITSRINMVACDNWTASLSVPMTAAFVQGDYLFKLVGSGGQASYVPLTVWDPASHATYVLENDIYTWQAWNAYGGYDFYQGAGACAPTYPPCNRALVESFDRPYSYGQGAADFLGSEYPLVRFVEQHGLDVTYATSADFETDPGFLLQHRAILSLGHDECWSLGERQAAQAAEAHGVNVVFFGASPVLRHVRMQPSPLGPDREEVDYRDSAADPLDGRGDPRQVTGNTWASPPASWPETPFVGADYTGYLKPGEPPAPFVVADASAWLFAGTGLHDGSQIPGLLVSDFDQFERGASPANTQILAHSPMPQGKVETSVADPASDTTYYGDPTSGAGVFDTGTVAWIPDLTSQPLVDEMTANLLAVFGRGPAGRIQPSVPNWQQFYR
jgi:hypothetical protein